MEPWRSWGRDVSAALQGLKPAFFLRGLCWDESPACRTKDDLSKLRGRPPKHLLLKSQMVPGPYLGGGGGGLSNLRARLFVH